jgi:hypothetical protein
VTRPDQAASPKLGHSPKVAVAVDGAGLRLERALAFKADQNALGRPDAQQRFTRAYVVDAFRRGENWEGYDVAWSAHWHEPLMSAVAGHRTVTEPARLSFAVAFDVPVVRFGMGRRWLRRYTREHGAAGNRSDALAGLALDLREEWLGRIDAWHSAIIDRAATLGAPPGALVNELGFLTAGGTAWLDRPLEPVHTPFRGTGHFGLLEGFDSGYYYYNTLDLWLYAFPALTLTFPALAEQVFRDYLTLTPMSGPVRSSPYAARAGLLRRPARLLERLQVAADAHPQMRPPRLPEQSAGRQPDPRLLATVCFETLRPRPCSSACILGAP